MLSGRRIAHRRLGQALASAGGETVLDVGAGTGSLTRVLPQDAFYWALDNDPTKLRRLSWKVPDARRLECSALDIELPEKAVDWTVCVAVAHHLDDEELPVMFSELARVTRRRLVFLDPLSSSKPGSRACCGDMTGARIHDRPRRCCPSWAAASRLIASSAFACFTNMSCVAGGRYRALRALVVSASALVCLN